MKKQNLPWPFIVASLVLFFLVTIWVKYPFIGDDWFYLYKGRVGLSMDDFGSTVTRAPLFSLISYSFFKWHLWEITWGWIYLFFFVQTWAFFGICRWFVEETALLDKLEGKKIFWFWSFISVLALYPCFYEVSFFPLVAPWSLGAYGLYRGLEAKKDLSRVFWLVLSFLILEMFVLPSLFLLWAPLFFGKFDGAKFRRRLVQWGAAVLCSFAIRWVVGQFFEWHSYHLVLGIKEILVQLERAIGLVWTIHFYKTNWFSTIVEWNVIGSLIFWNLRNQRIKIWQGFLVLALPLLSSANMLLINYYAPRGFFGAVLLRNAVLSFLFLQILIKSKDLRLSKGLAAILLVSYLVHHVLIGKNKNSNFQILIAKENSLVSAMQNCQEPCQIPVGDLAEGFNRDWVLPELFRKSFLDYVHVKHFPDKKIDFVMSQIETK